MGRERRPEYQQMGITPQDTSKPPIDYSYECTRHSNRTVWACYSSFALNGASVDEVAEKLGWEEGSVSGRTTELHHNGELRLTDAVDKNGRRKYIAIKKEDKPPDIPKTVRTYMVNEIFYSLQGEGARAGTANVFVRFAGCNLTCKVESHGFDCDTEFVSSRKLTAEEIVAEMYCVSKGKCSQAILTGGEPLLQIDDQLLYMFKNNGWWLAIETNGSLSVPTGIDWITVSPKVAEHALQQLKADEVKYVRGVGQGIPKTRVDAIWKYISPAWGGQTEQNLQHCIDLIKEHPEWRLSLQYHKVWSVR